MRKSLFFALFLLSSLFAKAQKNDTTIYGMCIPKNGNKLGPFVGQHNLSNRIPADECPKFPGGDRAIIKYLHKHLKWPGNEEDVRGKVFVSFIIEKNGSLSHLKIERGLTPEFNAEALRVVKLLPYWVPAKVKGKPVRCIYNIPVSFTFD